MSDYRLHQGHHEPRNLGEHPIDEPPDSKVGNDVGRVDTPELAAEICAAVNTARNAGTARDAGRAALVEQIEQGVRYWFAETYGHEIPAPRLLVEGIRGHIGGLVGDELIALDARIAEQDAELERLHALENTLSEGVWVVPGVKGGQACVGGTRVPVEQAAGLMADDVPADRIADYYPSVSADGAAAAHYFADRYVDRHTRDREETDPRTEVDAHWGGDPERLVAAWEADRAALRAEVEQARAAQEGAP